METKKTINHLLGAQQSLALAVAAGAGGMEDRDEKELRAMLIAIPGIIGRIESQMAGGVKNS